MATERLIIEIDEKGSRVVKRNIDNVAKASRGAEGAVTLLRRTLGLLGGALVLTSAVNTLADFSQQMSTVRAITQATGSQFVDLREKAKELGATTRFSASQAAEGMVFLARAGFETDEVLDSIGGTLQLAQAGALDLGSAADIASNILTGFRLETDQTGRVVDVLALASNSANTNVQQLGEAMKFVAPVAAGVGVSLEEATAAAAALSDAGLQSSLAGTGLRRVLSELESPASKTTKILRQLGLTTSDVRVSQVGLTTAIERLRKAGVDTGLALELFGDRGGPAFEVLATSTPKVKQLNTELQNAEGTAARIAEVMDDNLNGALLAVRSAVEAVIIEFGDFRGTDFLTGLLRSLASVLRDVAANMDTFGKIVDAVAIVVGVKFAQVALAAAIKGVIGLTLAIAANPLGALLTAVTTGSALLIAFSDDIKLVEGSSATLRDFFIAAFNQIKKITTEATNFMIRFFNISTKGSVDTVNSITGNFGSLLIALADNVDEIINNFDIGLTTIKVAWEDLPTFFKTIGILSSNAIISALETNINGAIRILNTLPGVEISSVTLGRLEADFFGTGSKLGDALQTALKERTDFTFFGDQARGVIQEALGAAAVRDSVSGESAGGRTGQKAKEQAQGENAVNSELQKRLGLLNQIRERLSDEATLLGFTNREREIESELLRIKRQFQDQGLELGAAEVELRGLLENNQALRDQADLLQDITGRQTDATAQLAALDALFADGSISVDQFNEKFNELRLQQLEGDNSFGAGFERAMLRFRDTAGTTADSVEQAFTTAFQGATDSLTNFFETGKFQVDDFFRTIASQLLRQGTQQLVGAATGQISSGVGGILSSFASGGGGGAGGGFGGLLTSFASRFAGFQNGGDFTVSSGTAAASLGQGFDNRLVAFRARDGEEVKVTPPGGSSGRPVNINFTVNTPDADSFRRAQKNITARTLSVLQRGDQDNN